MCLSHTTLVTRMVPSITSLWDMVSYLYQCLITTLLLVTSRYLSTSQTWSGKLKIGYRCDHSRRRGGGGHCWAFGSVCFDWLLSKCHGFGHYDDIDIVIRYPLQSCSFLVTHLILPYCVELLSGAILRIEILSKSNQPNRG